MLYCTRNRAITDNYSSCVDTTLVTVKVVGKNMRKGRHMKLYTTLFTNPVLPFSVNYKPVILLPLKNS